MTVTRRFTLGKNERLKSRKSIERLFSEGKKVQNGPFRLLYIHSPVAGTAALRMAASVSSKHFKKATDRNRIKRLMREAWRLQKNGLFQALQEQSGQLDVFIIYTDKELPPWDLVRSKTGQLIQQLHRAVSLK